MDDTSLIKNCTQRVIDWYRDSRRPLPWREEPTPYHVWISEIMLQQTRIEAVIPYYARFLAALPDIPSLAAVEDDRLMKLWEGLGYYSRARNLKKAAVRIMTDFNGALPKTAAELKTLPGIGDYTAGAIASIAYGEPEPAVDGNVLRVMMRVLAREDDVMAAKTRTETAALLRECYPRGEDAALLTEGLMELGETLCVPNGPARCSACPLKGLCLAEASGEIDRYPVRTLPKSRRIEARTVLLLRCKGRYALRRRPENGLLAGLWEFPNVEGFLTADETAALVGKEGLNVQKIAPCGTAKHIFTHVEWHMTGYLVDVEREGGGYLWKTPAQIEAEYPLPTALKAYKKKIAP
ncbi:MAG: A/G-specific adenine glycosylase [Oscillospiraceae bacterium]|nr:A/G-specific adenine glycosylase [Oscillospiraceae bacterium]